MNVLPPHLLSLLAEPEPYVVGLMDNFMKDIELLRKLSNVLCVHLDKNQFKTFGMKNPSAMIPDILTKSGKETVAHILYNDMQQVLKAESRVWAEGKEEVKTKETSAKDAGLSSEAMTQKKKKTKAKIPEIETDMPALFGRVMRGDDLLPDAAEYESFELLSGEEASDHARLDEASGHVPRKGEKFSAWDLSSISTFDVCENVRGEEGLRAALSFFFLVTHGDIGAILSEGPNGFLLDRKKYLLHKKKQGNKETGPLFALYKTFSGTSMLEHHLSQRLEEFERGKSLQMPRHRVLFSLCEKHLRVKKLEFSYANIRTVVSKTTVHSPLHALVERSEIARARALTLTSAQPFEGNVSHALSSLMQDCHQSDSSLPQCMAVVWSRLEDKKNASWKHCLLGLHLLKNLLLHGPLSVVSHVLDGIEKVRLLRFYEGAKSDDHNKEVRESAKVVWELATDGTRLLLRRGQVLASRAKLVDTSISERWGSYLLKKVPFHTGFRQYHTMLRPRPHSLPAFMKQEGRPTTELQQMEILRMKLSPLDETVTTSNNAAAELKRLREMRSSMHDGASGHSRASSPPAPHHAPQSAQAQGRPRVQHRTMQSSARRSMSPVRDGSHQQQQMNGARKQGMAMQRPPGGGDPRRVNNNNMRGGGGSSVNGGHNGAMRGSMNSSSASMTQSVNGARGPTNGVRGGSMMNGRGSYSMNGRGPVKR